MNAKELKKHIKMVDLANSLGFSLDRNNKARCYNSSAHKNGDQNPSLSIDNNHDTFKCFSCGVSGSVIDLYMGYKDVDCRTAISELNKIIPNGSGPVKANNGSSANSEQGYNLEDIKKWKLEGKTYDTCYTYLGKMRYIKIRFRDPSNRKDKKDLFFTEVEIDRFIKGRKCAPVFYNQNELDSRPNDIVCDVEGDPCADEMKELGFLSITSGGATVSDATLTQDMLSKLKGRDISIFQDNDVPGREAAIKKAEKFSNYAKSIRIIDIKPVWKSTFNEEMPEKHDIADFAEKYKLLNGEDDLVDTINRRA